MIAEDVKRKLEERRRERRKPARVRLSLPQVSLARHIKSRLRRRSDGRGTLALPRVRVGSYAITERVGKFVFAYDPDSGVCYVWVREKDPKRLGKWGFLRPLIENPDIMEVYVRGREVGVEHRRLGTLKVRYVDIEVTDEAAAKLVSSLSAYARAAADFEDPSGYGELDEWRIYVQLDIVSGEPDLSAVRMTDLPHAAEWLPPQAAARLMTLCLCRQGVVFFGPPGAGKTTCLNSYLNAIIEVFPRIKISVVETIRELRLPRSPFIHRTSLPSLFEKSDKERGITVSKAVARARAFQRPQLLVLGELRGDELRSWAEAVKAGIPCLTTVHSDSLEKCLNDLEAQLEAAGMPLDLRMHFRTFVHVNKRVTRDGRTLRYVETVYFLAPEPRIIYGRNGSELSEEEFKALLSELTTEFANSPVELYEYVKSRLGL